jgi:hypothetical protein
VRGSSVKGEGIFEGWMKETYQLQVRKYTTFPALFRSDHRGREGFSFTFRRVEGSLYYPDSYKYARKVLRGEGG